MHLLVRNLKYSLNMFIARRILVLNPEGFITDVCVCVIHLGRLLVTQPAFPYGASLELM